MTPKTWSQAVIMRPKKGKMQKRPNKISKHSISCPTFIHWKHVRSKGFKGKIGPAVNHGHNI